MHPYTDPCLSGHILSYFSSWLPPVVCFGDDRSVGGSGVKKAVECVHMFAVSVYICDGFCRCVYSRCMFVCPVILGTLATVIYF